MSWYLGELSRKSFCGQGVPGGSYGLQREVLIVVSHLDVDRDFSFGQINQAKVVGPQRSGVNRRGGEILGFHHGHFKRERSSRGVAKEVDPTRVDRVFGFKLLNKIVQVVRAIL